jgi:4-hydroxy-4-methyl-2-oxoglutarate aldolase
VDARCSFAGRRGCRTWDSTAPHAAADELRAGDVLVVEQCGDTRSCSGGMVSFTAATRGAVGAVISGSINDVEEILELGLPVFSLGVSALTTRILGVEGAINVPVTVGGAVVNPGDVVFGDSDGLAVLPRLCRARRGARRPVVVAGQR